MLIDNPRFNTAVLPAQTAYVIQNVDAIPSAMGSNFGWSSDYVMSYSHALSRTIEWSLTNQYMPKLAYVLAVACLGKPG
jgi:hypothetical protein